MYMLKRLLLSVMVLSAVSISSYAVDVNIPGADPTIARVIGQKVCVTNPNKLENL